jgi:hypothetical protein
VYDEEDDPIVSEWRIWFNKFREFSVRLPRLGNEDPSFMGLIAWLKLVKLTRPIQVLDTRFEKKTFKPDQLPVVKTNERILIKASPKLRLAQTLDLLQSLESKDIHIAKSMKRLAKTPGLNQQKLDALALLARRNKVDINKLNSQLLGLKKKHSSTEDKGTH